ncbi:hypothetical protein IWT140_00705 [Secundilactobacillus pentosiphilus]|uniref:GrpB family protein n=1 Tax=Secundilactobacillus pentosiphilus TaxID=1714682 RepID=A0A1Z5IMW5_9LACO|nr:GrpB family protein [Secundilactobacillus pentosiphilus]GAX03107.1 hypothetical protein IWT140_00705 [Secundilactobacillus pentosiphilus]
MKKLEEMSLHELWQLFPIVLRAPDPNYQLWYADEKQKIVQHLHSAVIYRINHIGSTSVPGLIAKPTVDILLELVGSYDLDSVISDLQSLKWQVMARNNRLKTIDLNKGYLPTGFAEKVYHLHVKPAGDWGELYFRDYLIANSDVAKQYGELKLKLEQKYKYNRDAYTAAKTDFVTRYTQEGREAFNGRYRPVK